MLEPINASDLVTLSEDELTELLDKLKAIANDEQEKDDIVKEAVAQMNVVNKEIEMRFYSKKNNLSSGSYPRKEKPGIPGLRNRIKPSSRGAF